jgi:hypothetical protein
VVTPAIYKNAQNQACGGQKVIVYGHLSSRMFFFWQLYEILAQLPNIAVLAPNLSKYQYFRMKPLSCN